MRYRSIHLAGPGLVLGVCLGLAGCARKPAEVPADAPPAVMVSYPVESQVTDHARLCVTGSAYAAAAIVRLVMSYHCSASAVSLVEVAPAGAFEPNATAADVVVRTNADTSHRRSRRLSMVVSSRFARQAGRGRECHGTARSRAVSTKREVVPRTGNPSITEASAGLRGSGTFGP